MSSNPYAALQDFVAGLPELLQPLMVGVVSMIPYVEGEGASVIGILVGINPIIATAAAITGNVVAVAAVVLLSHRVRTAVVDKRQQSRASGSAPLSAGIGGGAATATATETVSVTDPATNESASKRSESRGERGRKKIAKWVVRFGVPGASILAPIALPTHLTAAFLVASGVNRGWVMLWQIVAIVLWTSLVAVASFGLATFIGLI